MLESALFPLVRDSEFGYMKESLHPSDIVEIEIEPSYKLL
jgi:hypothetical protein